MGNPIDKNDIIGQKFGRWTVIKFDHLEGYKYLYLCRCECGTERLVDRKSLVPTLYSKSCGCFKIETTIKTHSKHGLYLHPLYSVWRNMKQRCYNPKNKKYLIYGAKGVKVCDEWLNDFQAFYDWSMNNGYKNGLSIDRINSNGNYESSNCRWATIEVQNHNISRNHLITFNNETHCISEWARILHINCNTLRSKILKGMSLKEIISSMPLR